MASGQSQFLTNPTPVSPLAFNLSITDDDDHNHSTKAAEDNDTRLMEMLAAQAAHREDDSVPGDEEAVLSDKNLAEGEKRRLLQKSLHMAASNGDIERVKRLVEGKAKPYIDLNAADEEGAAPLIYASCFVSNHEGCSDDNLLHLQGHHEVVSTLLDAGASVNRQDRNQWTALMWAMTNRHKDIAKILLDHGASPDLKSSSGRTALDFAPPNGEMSDYLHENGYQIGDVGVSGGDFYDNGFSQDRFEQEMEESELKRRMMMESSINLEVDLSSLGMDERPEVRPLHHRSMRLLTCVDTRRIRRTAALRLGSMPLRPDVCVSGGLLRADTRYDYYKHDSTKKPFTKARSGECHLPGSTLCALPCYT